MGLSLLHQSIKKSNQPVPRGAACQASWCGSRLCSWSRAFSMACEGLPPPPVPRIPVPMAIKCTSGASSTQPSGPTCTVSRAHGGVIRGSTPQRGRNTKRKQLTWGFHAASSSGKGVSSLPRMAVQQHVLVACPRSTSASATNAPPWSSVTASTGLCNPRSPTSWHLSRARWPGRYARGISSFETRVHVPGRAPPCSASLRAASSACRQASVRLAAVSPMSQTRSTRPDTCQTGRGYKCARHMILTKRCTQHPPVESPHRWHWPRQHAGARRP